MKSLNEELEKRGMSFPCTKSIEEKREFMKKYIKNLTKRYSEKPLECRGKWHWLRKLRGECHLIQPNSGTR